MTVLVRSNPRTLKLAQILDPRTRFECCYVCVHSRSRKFRPIFLKFTEKISSCNSLIKFFGVTLKSSIIFTSISGWREGEFPQVFGFWVLKEQFLNKYPRFPLHCGRANCYTNVQPICDYLSHQAPYQLIRNYISAVHTDTHIHTYIAVRCLMEIHICLVRHHIRSNLVRLLVEF